MSAIVKATDCKCIICGKQAVTFYPVIDPDIPSYPYCPACLEKAMIEMAKVVWKDDDGMQAIAVMQAREARKKYEKG
jgi:hypothetical protein